MLSTGSTQEDPFQHNWKIVDWDVKNQIKHTNMLKILWWSIVHLWYCWFKPMQIGLTDLLFPRSQLHLHGHLVISSENSCSLWQEQWPCNLWVFNRTSTSELLIVPAPVYCNHDAQWKSISNHSIGCLGLLLNYISNELPYMLYGHLKDLCDFWVPTSKDHGMTCSSLLLTKKQVSDLPVHNIVHMADT